MNLLWLSDSERAFGILFFRLVFLLYAYNVFVEENNTKQNNELTIKSRNVLSCHKSNWIVGVRDDNWRLLMESHAFTTYFQSIQLLSVTDKIVMWEVNAHRGYQRYHHNRCYLQRCDIDADVLVCQNKTIELGFVWKFTKIRFSL